MDISEEIRQFIKINFGKKRYKVLSVFPILWYGWESDYDAVLLSVNNRRYVIGTNHGVPYFLSQKELLLKVKEYTDAVAKTTHAILLMEQKLK